MFGTRTLFLLTASGLVLFTAGCGDSTSAHSPGTTMSTAMRTDFDDADVSFLQMMYPHHAQAVAMAELVPSRSRDQQVVALAAAIRDAQAPEMERMSELLRSFGKPAPATGDHSMPDMPGMATTPGMMPDADMDRLRTLSGAEFDRAWLQMMIDHHSGAITMANDELAHGDNGDAKALAQSIIAAQQSEIDRMRTMLGS
ncbi:DUF305 domain-containing protein [Nocardia aurantia]|uniref:DUF305 domain-containing protein n=1 Tax=Nocardia aurantia TaxID=2585199 RepID=A0A7K0DHP6_9NOCA|nr:DUF305 domain-containing protein [Nocardia aurantia]MQY24822.1 hypothetical protein [Nocardia aurantia]